jgi:hypothetical protein
LLGGLCDERLGQQQQLGGPRVPDAVQQPRGERRVAGQADPGERRRELGTGRRDAEVTGQGDPEPCTGAGAVDAHDDRYP